MKDSEFLSLIPQDSNPIFIGTKTIRIAWSLLGRALVERGYENRPCPDYALKSAAEYWISQGFHFVAVGVEEPVPYRAERFAIFLKELTEPLHPVIHPISGDKCARCRRKFDPRYSGRAILSIPPLPPDFPEHYAKFLTKAQDWVMKNLCIKCAPKMQAKYKGLEIKLESEAEFMARLAINYPWAYEFDDSVFQQLSLADAEVTNLLPPAIH